MSKFYQRYVSGVKKDESSSSLIGASKTRPVDPTAMTPSHAARPASSRVAGASSASVTASGPAPARRVQIFNSSDSFSPDEQRQLAVFNKPEAAKAFLRGAIGAHYLFESLGPEDLNRIIDCMKPTFATANEQIIKQGELGDLFFCLESGNAFATVNGTEVMRYESGGCFGELALIYNSPRAASVIATTACKLWTLDLRTFRYILATTSSSKMVTRCEFLKKCSFLDPLSNEQISKLAGALETVTLEDGEYIVRQGDVADSFFIIEEGSVKCTQVKSTGREVDLLTLKAGDYFGEMALMLNDTRHANCIAVGKVRCLTLDRVKFGMLLGSVQEVLAKRMRVRILQSVPLLAKLPEAKLIKLSSVMRVQSFADGAYIIRQGEEGSRFYIINEGEVRCTRLTAPGKEEELIRLTAQEFFGERALITNEARKANVISCGPVECLVLERSSFQSLLTDVQDDLVSEIQKRENKENKPVATEEEVVDLNPRTNFSFDELRIMRTVGTGTFGRVKMVQHVPTSQVCALKCMNKSEVVASHQERNIMAEKNLLFECSASPFILKLLQTYNTPNQIMMLMEFIQGGELWSYIYEKTDTVPRCQAGGFELPAVKFYAANVILAFKHIHNKNIAYRDLKPENLLIDGKGYVKLIDFGFAKKFPYTKNGQKHDKTYTLCGTPEYLAPEIVMSKGYDKAVDYWALGCLIYELYLARTPFQADYTTKIFQNIIAAEKVLSFPRGMDPQHVALVKKLLSFNPAFRLGTLSGGIDEILRDPFFSTVDWTSVTAQEASAPFVPPISSGLDSSNFDDYEEEETIPEYVGSQEHFANF
jgi:cGMP-dependent protein kinase